MQNHEESTNNEQKDKYFSSCYISTQFQEIIFTIMQVEFVDQLCEREPVIVLGLDTSPQVVGLTVKAILAESNKENAIDNPLLSTNLSDISQGEIFYSRNDYATYQIGKYAKQDKIGKAYYDMPGYQASKSINPQEFYRHYLNFSIRATDNVISINLDFNEWNPIQFSKQVSLEMKNEELGALFLGFSSLLI